MSKKDQVVIDGLESRRRKLFEIADVDSSVYSGVRRIYSADEES